MCSRTPRSTSLPESPPCNRRHPMPAFVPPNLVLCDRLHATKSPFPAAEVASMPPRVLTSSALTTNLEDSLNDPGQTRATGTQSERTASTPEGLGQAAGTYTTYTGGFRTVDRTEGISEATVASGPVNPTCCLNPDATAVPPSLPCLFSGDSSTPRRSLSSGSAENQDGGQATNTGARAYCRYSGEYVRSPWRYTVGRRRQAGRSIRRADGHDG